MSNLDATASRGAPHSGAPETLIVVPSFSTAASRVKVQCANNIFFDVSNADFTINPDPSCTNDLVLASQTITDSQVFEAGNSIAAGPAFVVAGTGAATFRTPGTIMMNSGFAVQAGGSFTAQIVPGICP